METNKIQGGQNYELTLARVSRRMFFLTDSDREQYNWWNKVHPLTQFADTKGNLYFHILTTTVQPRNTHDIRNMLDALRLFCYIHGGRHGYSTCKIQRSLVRSGLCSRVVSQGKILYSALLVPSTHADV